MTGGKIRKRQPSFLVTYGAGLKTMISHMAWPIAMHLRVRKSSSIGKGIGINRQKLFSCIDYSA